MGGISEVLTCHAVFVCVCLYISGNGFRCRHLSTDSTIPEGEPLVKRIRYNSKPALDDTLYGYIKTSHDLGNGDRGFHVQLNTNDKFFSVL